MSLKLPIDAWGIMGTFTLTIGDTSVTYNFEITDPSWGTMTATPQGETEWAYTFEYFAGTFYVYAKHPMTGMDNLIGQLAIGGASSGSAIADTTWQSTDKKYSVAFYSDGSGAIMCGEDYVEFMYDVDEYGFVSCIIEGDATCGEWNGANFVYEEGSLYTYVGPSLTKQVDFVQITGAEE